ncbi:hypothetical protein NM688_g6382 [Phlebia brevispora]|uniref:Uncharacterized protein n=1 Tax=Phlebia brevispora TaxID=194682 RepID=A0ACC1SGT7_9APHY|nr:hypothetical protein NM688_g6382 [Phlebia brevispora]
MPQALGSFSAGDFVSDAEFEKRLEEIERVSSMEYEHNKNARSFNAVAGPSRTKGAFHADGERSLQDELSRLENSISETQLKLQSLLAEKHRVTRKLQEHRNRTAAEEEAAREREQPTVNYMDDFDWTPALRTTMKRIFNIDDFRLCQKGVCNASVDGRDIICGGKSLTYQLPAVMAHGCTIVISPLISLMADQVHHMLEAGVDAVMIMSSTSKEEKQQIYRRFDEMARGQGKDIKLCYITPERMAKDKTFVSRLQRLSEAKKLVRVVIDEAHCISQLGHDYRPDYRKLSSLRQWFPDVPIQALSATCPPAVRSEIVSILRLKKIADGTACRPNTTVYFSSPLYRKNLHYKVLQKPAAKAAVLKTISDYILQHHLHDSGIIYCFTVKESEDVAEGIRAESKGKIKTGVYNARLSRVLQTDLIKPSISSAFGLGIDKGNVRFVIHHSMSKSLDGFYQESGRAGRDGLDADCVLYYRHQDAMRIREVTFHEPGSDNKRECEPDSPRPAAHVPLMYQCVKWSASRWTWSSAGKSTLPSTSSAPPELAFFWAPELHEV